MFIHELKDWPRFHWNRERLAEPLAAVRHQQGRLIGHMEALGFNLRQEAVLQTLTEDVLKSSEIEGEKLDPAQVRSSIARRLGMDIGALKPADRNVEGVVEMMLDATRHYDQPLTDKRLFAWHGSLIRTGRSGMTRISAGAWRDDSKGQMQVVSGPMGKERVHFEAPKAKRLPGEMGSFPNWFEGKEPTDPVLKAGLRIPGQGERDSGMKVNTDSGLKPNTFCPTPEWRSPSSRNRFLAIGAGHNHRQEILPSRENHLPARRLSLRKIKEVLRLKYELRLGHRQIARSCSMGLGTVHDYLARAERAGLEWPLPESWDEDQIRAALFGGTPARSRETERAAPDFAMLHQQRQTHKHVTLQLLWEEYRVANPEGYQYSRF